MEKYEEQLHEVLEALQRSHHQTDLQEYHLRSALTTMLTMVHTLHGEVENLRTHRTVLYEIVMTLVRQRPDEERKEVLAVVDHAFGKHRIHDE